MISSYNDTEPAPGPRNLMMIIGKRLTLRGFIVSDHEDLRPQFEAEVGQWLAEGKIVLARDRRGRDRQGGRRLP